MTLDFVYWFLMLVWVIFSGWGYYRTKDYVVVGGSLLQFLLFLVLGIRLFWPIIRG